MRTLIACLCLVSTVVADDAEILKKVTPAVVAIKTDRGAGTGFIIDRTTIVTSLHVVTEAKVIQVVMDDGVTFEAKEFRATNKPCDICLLHVDIPRSAVPTLKICEQRPEAGNKVLAFGRIPKKAFDQGKVAELRTAEDSEAAQAGRAPRDSLRYPVWVVHSASTTQGNSGGPVVNERAEVVGVTTWIGGAGAAKSIALSCVDLKEIVGGKTGKLRPISELPILSSIPATPEKLDATANLKAWNVLAKARGDRNLSWKEKSPKVSGSATYTKGIATAYSKFAGRESSLPVQGVDIDLLAAASEDFKLNKRLAGSWSNLSDAIRNRDLRRQQVASREIDELNKLNAEQESAFSDLRVRLSRKYKVDFGPVFQAPDKPASSQSGQKKRTTAN